MAAPIRRSTTRMFLRRFASHFVSVLMGYFTGQAMIHYPRQIFISVAAPVLAFIMLSVLERYGYARVLWNRLSRDLARYLRFSAVRIYGSANTGISIVIGLSKGFIAGFFLSLIIERFDFLEEGCLDTDNTDNNIFFSVIAPGRIMGDQ